MSKHGEEPVNCEVGQKWFNPATGETKVYQGRRGWVAVERPQIVPKFAVNDIVSTDFTGVGRRTVHRIVATQFMQSQSQCCYRVSPPVPRSGGPMSWLDEAWFQLVRKAGT